MKNVFSIVFVLLSGFVTYGQVEKPILKGNYTLGGSVGFSITSQTTDENDNLYISDFNFSPSLGYFFVDRLTLALSPILSRSKVTNTYHQLDSVFYLRFHSFSTITSLGLAPFVKYYFTNGFFVTANIKYSKNWGKSNSNVDGFAISYDSNKQNIYSETKSNYDYASLGFGLGVGYAYFINSKVSIDGSLSYQREKQIKSGETNKRSSNFLDFSKTDISADLTKSTFFISVGLNVFL